MMKLEQKIAFLKVIEQFKSCTRQCRTSDTTRAESDAEHSWHLATFFVMLENEFDHVDFTQILKLALIHDLPEIYAGDTNPYRGDTSNKEENERSAAKKLFSILPDPAKSTFNSLFREYLDQKSVEAQIVKAADKLMPLIQNICTCESYSSYRDLKVEYYEVKKYMDPFFQEEGVLKNFYLMLLEEARERGVFYKGKK